MLIHPLVTDTATLEQLCARWASADFVAVDTEFMRESTYYPDLCLVQVACPNEAAAIGQDLEIIYNLTGRTPQPLFDTQVAAMALGLGEQIGYTNLVAAYSNIQIDKGARFTDWARRPLNDRQLEYAIGDVTHLAKIFPRMVEKLRRTGRGEWLDEEMARVSDPATYANAEGAGALA